MSTPVQLDRERLLAEVDALGHYRIDRFRLHIQDRSILGSGGYGTVKLAELLTDGSTQKVAVKILRSETAAMDLRVAFRLVREMKVWARLQHENILPFLGFHLNGEFDEALLISQYEPHGSVLQYLKVTKPDNAIRLRFALQALRGLAYLHQSSPPICHGDVKGANILINQRGEAVLCDLGLVRVLEGGPTGLTTSDGFKGSITWCGPELLEGESRTLASDMWAWACTLLEASDHKYSSTLTIRFEQSRSSAVPYRTPTRSVNSLSSAVSCDEILRSP